MFKNFDKVFKFTFKNQAKTKSYITLTVTLALIFLILPGLIMFLVDYFKKKDEGVKDSGVKYVYVVNPDAPDADYNILNMLGTEYYEDIKYMNVETVDEALDYAAGSQDTIVLEFYEKDNELCAGIILPNDSNISTKEAGYFNDFIDENEQFISIFASGISMQELMQLSQQTESEIYSAKGYEAGKSLNDDANASEDIAAKAFKPIFSYIIIFVSMMILYIMIASYGGGVSNCVVLEKSSKLMDTMLISVKPEALVFGKLLGIVSAGLLQLFIWIISIAVGFFAGFAILESRGSGLPIQAFFKMMSGLGLFSVPKIILAIITIIFGILLYCSLSCFAGAISKNREEAASNNTIFMMVLLASFYIVFFFGLSSAGEGLPLWMMFVPPVAAMVLPAALCLGTISFGAGALAVALLVGIAIAVTITSGRLYKMMSLYKGNNVKIGKALKMLFSGQG